MTHAHIYVSTPAKLEVSIRRARFLSIKEVFFEGFECSENLARALQ